MAITGVSNYNSVYENAYVSSRKEAAKKEETKVTAATQKTTETAKKSSNEEYLKNLQKQVPHIKLQTGYGLNANNDGKVNIVDVSPKLLEKMQNDPKAAREYTQRLKDIESATKWVDGWEKSMYNTNMDYSSLFGGGAPYIDNSMGGINVSDYAMIKNGSYGKLMKAYYAKQDAEKTAGTGHTSQKLTLMKTSVDSLKKSADALNASSLWEKKKIKKKDEKTGEETEVEDYDWEAITKAVKSFIEDYNDVVKEAGESNTKDVLRNAVWMTGMTDNWRVEQGWAIDKDGNISSWAIGHKDPKAKSFLQKMSEKSDEIRQKKLEKPENTKEEKEVFMIKKYKKASPKNNVDLRV